MRTNTNPSYPTATKPISWAVGVVILVIMIVAVYGLSSWFFPSENFLSVFSAPAVICGLLAAFLLCRYGRFDSEELKRRKMRKSFVCLGAGIFLPILSWTAFCVGAPAVITKVLGPNGETLATISIKKERGATRKNQLGLAGYSTLFKGWFWVPDDIFNQVHVGEEVSLLVRQDFFGTRIFDIKVKNQANPTLNRTRATTARAG